MPQYVQELRVMQTAGGAQTAEVVHVALHGTQCASLHR
jgi:hypothetical protein